MTLIKKLYSDRTIQNITTAVSAMESLKKKDFNEFGKKYEDILNKVPGKEAKTQKVRETKTAAIDAKISEAVRIIERPSVHTKNWETEAPSTEIIFKKTIKSFEEAWKTGKNLLIKSVEAHMTAKQPNMKLTIAIEYSMIKMKVDDEDEDPDEINLVRVGRERIGISKTKAVNVYNTGSIRPTILNLKRELETKFFNGLENQVGSNWAIDKVIKLFAQTYTLKTKKGSSYIPTPARFAASKCGLINIRNEDQFCFRWCMLYHQSEQSKHSHRLTVLEKLEDKFNYESITYPTSLQDIQQFEEDNEITINVFTIKGGDELVNL
jgi:hypothetical protein